MEIQGETITLRTITANDLPVLWNFIYGKPDPEWKNGMHRILNLHQWSSLNLARPGKSTSPVISAASSK